MPAPLILWVPLPPPDNHCHLSNRYGRYPTRAYQDWLRVAAPLLREALGEREPDRECWWEVVVDLRLGTQGDGPNYLKPLLDLLSGAQAVERSGVDEQGRRVTKGQIVKPGGLWDDDRRVRLAAARVTHRRDPEPGALLTARPCPPPVDVRAQREAEERAEKAASREAAREAREAAKAAAKAERESRKADEQARKAVERETAKAAARAARAGR